MFFCFLCVLLNLVIILNASFGDRMGTIAVQDELAEDRNRNNPTMDEQRCVIQFDGCHFSVNGHSMVLQIFDPQVYMVFFTIKGYSSIWFNLVPHVHMEFKNADDLVFLA